MFFFSLATYFSEATTEDTGMLSSVYWEKIAVSLKKEYPVMKLSFRNNSKIKVFSDQKKHKKQTKNHTHTHSLHCRKLLRDTVQVEGRSSQVESLRWFFFSPFLFFFLFHCGLLQDIEDSFLWPEILFNAHKMSHQLDLQFRLYYY